jgi:hypothetical protein
MKTQTAVEWLEEQIKDIFYVAEASEMTKKFKSVYEQAKQMEKEQIDNFIDFINERHFNRFTLSKDEAEIYYNETYGGNITPRMSEDYTFEDGV